MELRLGAVVAADVNLTLGEVLLDQSMLTGESVPIEASVGMQTYAGALVRRGEAVAEVTATGARTRFGRTAELIRTAHAASTQQKAVLRVVRNLAAFSGVVVVLLVAYAWLLKMPLDEIVPLVLTAILASIPVALPATFTVAAAVGARLWRNSASFRPAFPPSMKPLRWIPRSDKTGTLTQNALPRDGVRDARLDEGRVLVLGELAVPWWTGSGRRSHPHGRRQQARSDAPRLVKFAAFDPAKKMSEATAIDFDGKPTTDHQGRLRRGHRPCAGVADGGGARARSKGLPRPGDRGRSQTAMKLAGLIALSDPPRPDSAALVSELHGLGVRTVMVTVMRRRPRLSWRRR